MRRGVTDRASIRDVARLASVSRQTVSRALNEPDTVSPDTLQRVREAVAQLGYRPNLAARSLKTRQTGVFGVVVNPMSRFAMDQEVARLGHLAGEREMALLVNATYDDSYDGTRAAITRLLDQRIEGLFVMSPLDRGLDVALAVAPTIPVVVVQSGVDLDGIATVDADQELGVHLLVDHLVGLGHRRIDHVSGPRNWVAARVRTEAFVHALDRHGIAPGVTYPGDFRPQMGFDAGVRMVERGLPDAVFASSDLTAQGVVRAFADAGVAVPDQVSVAGFDDVVGTSMLVPRLTTVRQPLDEVCRAAMEVMDELRRGGAPRRVLLAPELVVRESVGPCRGAAT